MEDEDQVVPQDAPLLDDSLEETLEQAARRAPGGSWEALFKGAAPPARHAHSCVFYDGFLWVFGGFAKGVHLNDLFRYSLASRTWEELLPFNASPIVGSPIPMHSHTAVEHGGYMWVFGGIGKGGAVSSSLYRIKLSGSSAPPQQLQPQPSPWAWEIVEPATGSQIPPPRWGHSACVVDGLGMVIYGGMPQTGPFLKDVHVFNFPTGSWWKINAAPTSTISPKATEYHTMSLVQGEMLVFGGYDGVMDRGELFSLRISAERRSYTWTDRRTKPAPPPRRAHTAVVHEGGVMVFAGRGKQDRFRDLWRYDLASSSWRSLASEGDLPSARTFHTACMCPGGIMAVFGGQGASNFNDLHFLKLQRETSPTRKVSPFLSLVASDSFSDVAFRLSDGGTVPAHRAILCCKSEYFKAMLSGPLSHTASGSSAVPVIELGGGLTRKLLLQALRYLYTGDDVWDIAGTMGEIADLITLADQWLMTDLKQSCEAALICGISDASLDELGRLAEFCRCPRLAEACAKYLRDKNCTMNPGTVQIGGSPTITSPEFPPM